MIPEGSGSGAGLSQLKDRQKAAINQILRIPCGAVKFQFLFISRPIWILFVSNYSTAPCRPHQHGMAFFSPCISRHVGFKLLLSSSTFLFLSLWLLGQLNWWMGLSHGGLPVYRIILPLLSVIPYNLVEGVLNLLPFVLVAYFEME